MEDSQLGVRQHMSSFDSADSSQTAVAARTLSAIVAHSACLETVRRGDLRSGDWVVITTKNSVYLLCVLGTDNYSVSGGWFDQKSLSPTPVAVNGCTWGGSAINHDIVAAPGLFLEFANRVMTTRIQHVRVYRTGKGQPIN